MKDLKLLKQLRPNSSVKSLIICPSQPAKMAVTAKLSLTCDHMENHLIFLSENAINWNQTKVEWSLYDPYEN